MIARSRSVVLLGVLFAAILAYCTATIAEGYLRAPRVAAAQRGASSTTPVQLSAEQVRILLAVEDPKFFSHHGIDVRTPGAGMTTITQGLVKAHYFTRFRPGIAKIRQSLLALGLDARIGKREQLAMFAGSVYLGTRGGRELHGFEEAARVYFGKPFERLSRNEYVSLVAMCVGPNALSVATHPEANARRVARIERMLRGKCRPTRWRDVYYESCGE